MIIIIAATLKALVAALVRSGSLLSLTMAACVFIAVPLSAAPLSPGQGTLAAVKESGEVRCGVTKGLPGLSAPDEKGQWSGFDVDFCRALAAAIFNDPSKVAFTPLDPQERFPALASGAIDVLSRITTWTLTAEAGLGMQFAAITYYDGQGFMVHKSRNVSSASELGGATICVNTNTTTELNLQDYFRHNKVKELPVATAAEAVQAYDGGDCDAITSDIVQLHSGRLLLKDPDASVVLPDVISKEPLGPVVHAGDDQWLNLVKWTHFAMVNAEELGVSQKTLPEAMEWDSARVRRLLGSYAALGEALGLSNDWAARIVRHVGNYGEVFDRNLGPGTKLAIPRGLNRLWTNGGLQYAPPLR